MMKIGSINATFQPSKIGTPHGLQITYLKDNSTRNIFVYHEDGKVKQLIPPSSRQTGIQCNPLLTTIPRFNPLLVEVQPILPVNICLYNLKSEAASSNCIFGKEIVDWFNAIRAARFHYLQVAFPVAAVSEVRTHTHTYTRRNEHTQSCLCKNTFSIVWPELCTVIDCNVVFFNSCCQNWPGILSRRATWRRLVQR